MGKGGKERENDKEMKKRWEVVGQTGWAGEGQEGNGWGWEEWDG